jgi:hypothetical protein
MLRLYHKLGKLFYAIASADKTVSKEEAEKLYQFVKQDWVPVEETSDAFGTDAAFQIISAFDLLNDQMASSKSCMQQFEDFYHSHKYLFTDQIKTLTLRTANAIAAAFKGQNKSELIAIQAIHRLFKD